MPPTWPDDTGTSTTWIVWVRNNATSSSTTDIVWGEWVNYGTTASNVWGAWTATTSSANFVPLPHAYQPVPETEEQRAARIERERQQAEERQRREAERVAAQERAEQLLRDQLTIEQAAQLVQGNYFEVISESGKRYQVTRGIQGNVFAYDGARRVGRYCIHPDTDVPVGDVMLAQKLMLETCEREFLRIANHTPVAA